MSCKICGISDSLILKYLIQHPYSPKMIGFICNFKQSPRYVEIDKLKKLVNVDKKNCKFVAVLVNPNDEILEDIKDLNFDYYQLYDCDPLRSEYIKKKYKIKIIIAITIQNAEDVRQYKKYENVADIFLFDSKGYEKSLSFEHSLISNLKINKKLMIAGNIKYNDNLENLKKIADIIDISGGLETSGLKDISKIETFLNNINNLNNET